ncbi:MAG: protein kinase [Thermoanaerobaculia bacterium]
MDIGSELLGQTIDIYTIKSVLGRGFYGWTVHASDPYQDFAVKIVPQGRLRAGQLGDQEAQALARCSPHRNIARLYRVFNHTFTIQGQQVEARCLVFEFIADAQPLDLFFRDHTLDLSRGDITSILTGIASGLIRMHSRGLWHYDLHGNNILVRRVDDDENLRERFEAKIIDLGSAQEFCASESADRGDYGYLAKHIYSAVARFEERNLLTPSDRAFAERLRRLAHRVADLDVSRRNLTPTQVREEIESIATSVAKANQFPSFSEMLSQNRVSLQDPLENTNALTLAPQDIVLLFTDTLDWTRQINKSEAVIVIGPRGCGKTMLFRYLSLASQARPRPQERDLKEVVRRLEGEGFMSFLVSCGELRTPFMRSQYKKLQSDYPHIAEDFCREFINSRLLLEVTRTLLWIMSESLASISDVDLEPLRKLIIDLLGPRVEALAQHRIETLIEVIERRVILLSRLTSATDYEPSGLSSDDILVRVGEAIRAIPWAANKEPWFLLDDYSVTVLPEFVQQAYNPVLFRLATSHRVKISSEGDGPILSDTMGRKYQEGRELRKVNLGEIYFRESEDRGRKFFEDILAARFRATGKGSLEEMRTALGEHEHEKGFGKYIVSHKRLGDTRFYGFGLLCTLCSGDVSFVIELMSKLMSDRWGNMRPIPSRVQDSITKSYAQRQLADLRRVADHGQRLYEFAMRVGGLLRDYLVKSAGKNSADERLRIEVEGTGDLSEAALRMQAVLLRHSVLVDGGAGKSRDGAPTRRLFFRRLFAPCFPFSPARKGCIPIRILDYQRWLEDPKSIWSEPARHTPLFDQPSLGDE